MKKRGQAQTIAIILLSILLIIVILLLMYLNTPLFTGKTVTTTQVYNVPQQTQRYCTTITIPYTTTEQYVEQVPYYEYDDYRGSRRDYTDSGDYEYIDSTFDRLSVKGKVRIYNRDDRSRFFTIKMYYTPRKGDTVIKEDYGYVRGGESRTFTTYYYDNQYNNGAYINFDYDVDPEGRDYRVLRYRDEIKTRTVTKYKTEEVCN